MTESEEAKLAMEKMKVMQDVIDATGDALESQWELVKEGKCTADDAAAFVAAATMGAAKEYFRTLIQEGKPEVPMNRIHELEQELENNKDHKKALMEADRMLRAELSATMTNREARLYLLVAHAELVFGEELIEELIEVYRENESLKRHVMEVQRGREEWVD